MVLVLVVGTSRSALVALLVGVVGGMLCMLRFERLPGKAKTPRIDGGNDKRSYQSRLVGPRFCFQGMKSPRFTGPGPHRNHIEWVDGRMSLWILYNGFTS